MKVGIVGLLFVGKTTIFNALTKAKARTGDSDLRPKSPNKAIIKLPDERLYKLSELSRPKKVTPAEIEYIDVGGLVEEEKKKKSEGQFYATLKETDELLEVVRAFENESIVHLPGKIDPKRDIKNFDDDLMLLDLDLVERRISRLERNIKVGKCEDREELGLLSKFRNCLEQGIPLRKLELSSPEEKLTRGYGFLSLKPTLVLLNINEDKIGSVCQMEKELKDCMDDDKMDICAVCGKLEMELSQLGEEDKRVFMQELCIEKSALDKVVRSSYRLLNLIPFFTANQNEVKAWAIESGSTALEAAGTVHSDMAKGFIKAEVISYEKLIELGSTAKAREKGELRLEGKDYVVKDGDVIFFRFNV